MPVAGIALVSVVVGSTRRRSASALAALSRGRTGHRIWPERASIRSTRLKSQRA